MKRKNRTTKNTTMQRNIGIIAHVDAGKTTVTERILFYSGKSHAMGDVHHGNTQMDVDPSEQKHGITVNSAATAVQWRGHHINIIDTPGHIDFNIEVRRALRVLDGAVVVFDAVAGVEPQSETNWRLADEFGLPRVCFINKMDRTGADCDRVCAQIAERFGVVTLPLQLPLGEAEGFRGVVDVLRQRALVWTDKQGLEISEMPIHPELELAAREARQHLLERVAESDEALIAEYLETGSLDETALVAAIRKGTLAGDFVPVLCGSAFKNRAVQPLLDAVVDYLPSPFDREDAVKVDAEGVVAFAFKIAPDKSFGMLTYCRIYAGELRPGDVLTNSSNGKREKVSRLYEMHADSHEVLPIASAGDIVALPGMKNVHTGDTLCADGAEGIVLERIIVPEPVTSVAVEPASRDDADKLGACLARLAQADPTLRIATDPESGQTVLSGMGELHLEIARERLDAFGVQVNFGQPVVSYRETIRASAGTHYLHSKQTGGPGQYAGVKLVIKPLERGEGIVFENAIVGGAIPGEYIAAVERGSRKAASNGVLGGHEVIDVLVIVTDGDTHPNDSSAHAFETAAAKAFAQAMVNASPVVLEPVMRIDVTTPEESLGEVIGDLSGRRGAMLGTEAEAGAHVLLARVPLAIPRPVVGDPCRSITLRARVMHSTAMNFSTAAYWHV